MPQRTVHCPSGLEGVMRGLKGRELRALGDKRRARSGELFDDLLAACWLETTDPGPYHLDNKGRPPWLDVLSGDRFYALFQLRLATYPGEPYSFNVKCLNRQCGNTFGWDLPLEELPVKELPPESLERFKAGKPFETTMAGHRVTFALSTGRHEQKGARYVKASSADLLQVLALRIIEIEGVEQKDKLAWLEDLELQEHRDMLLLLDEVDCGIETSIEVVCNDCDSTQRIDIPFGPGFFLPKRQQ